ncbi:MAG: DEAD/DEAH box helicase [Candidatus Methanomethylophilaceae archaeon]|nr:DEAD/DEAH box helicase [Candidatus Methanomethylophilaceae archaeon]
MVFDPLSTSKNICDTFRRYILSTFKTSSDSYNFQLEKILLDDGTVVKGPYLQISHNYPVSLGIKDLIDEGVLSEEFISLGYTPLLERKLYVHQEEAVRKVINGRNVVVSTGTGSGKTECFLIPILDSLMKEKEAGTLGSGVRVMLLYPMNALVNDQLERMRNILLNYPHITFGTFTGETEDTEMLADLKDEGLVKRLPNEVYDRHSFRKSPPHIVITNYAMLEHLLIKPDNSPLFGDYGANHWKYIVLDEVHTYGGAKGSEVSMLLRRLKATLGKDDVKFILTSATLGTDKDDQVVADFASDLCSTKFESSDVIRSLRPVPPSDSYTNELGLQFYHDVSNIVCSSSGDVELEIGDYLREHGYVFTNPREKLYDLTESDGIIHRISKELDESPLVLKQLADKEGISESDLVDIIVTTTATKKLGNRVMNAKYHLFVQGLDGASVTLSGSDKFFTKPQQEYEESDGRRFRVFQISTCYNCNAIFLLGNSADGYFKQVSRNSVEYRGYEPFLLINDQKMDPDYYDESKSKTFALCSLCGSITPGTELRCQCGQQYRNLVVKVQPKEKLSTCPVCGNTDTSRGLLRQLYLGNDSSTSVIASSLFKDLLNSRDSRFLAFSDSRQGAAFFAPYMNDTYRGILMKRVIYETMIRNIDKLTTGVSFTEFREMVFKVASEYTNLSKADVLESIVRECSQNNSYRSLEYQGFLRFEYAYNNSGTEWVAKPMPEYGLYSDQVYHLFNTLVKHVRDKRAVTIEDTDFKPYGYRKGYVVDGPASARCSKFLNDSIKGYLMAIIDDEAKVKEFATKFISGTLSYSVKDSCSYLDLERLKVSIPTHMYYCSTCRKYYPFNMNKICIRCCTPTLEEKKVNAVDRVVDGVHLERNVDMSNHYVRTCVDSPLHSFRIVEHTAQLDAKKARDYQNLFKNKKIDALSCSTTFEMGVDIGSLNSIFLRNVPPSPANYVQRAGRAGRGEDASSFTVTFCKSASHDLAYYDDPLMMICGKISVPLIKVDNPAIVIRHVYASAFSFYWKSQNKFPSKVSDFIGEYPKLREYLLSKPPDLKGYLKSIVPKSICDVPDGIDIENYGWLGSLFEAGGDEIGRLECAVAEYSQDDTILSSPLVQTEQAIQNGQNSIDRMKELQKSLGSSIARKITIDRGETLDFLSRYNLIPKYGFPADVVPMVPASGSTDLNLSRDLLLAISEFAPGSEVIADGKKVRCEYVTTIRRGREHGRWVQYRYRKCDVCGKVTAVIDNDLDDDPLSNQMLSQCSCGKSLGGTMKKFIKPDMGFKYRESNISLLEKPERTYSSDISFCDSYNSDEAIRRIGNEDVQLISRSNGKLVAINDSNFMICESCGYAILASKIKKQSKIHNRPDNKECSNALKSMSLGHVFRTDVLIIRFYSHRCKDHNTALSVLYALVEGFCRAFSIERNEVRGCLDNIGGEYIFILFDNTPGGSGYVKLVSDDNSFRLMIAQATALVHNCTCGGKDGDSACYSCLRNYSNQRVHDDLKRGLALRYFESLNLGGQ